jgi:hypothetical protein
MKALSDTYPARQWVGQVIHLRGCLVVYLMTKESGNNFLVRQLCSK